MQSKQKQVSYVNYQPYETLNRLTDSTENIWVIFHGMGYLSRYFLRYFKDFDESKNYFIAPQAPSKYYLKEDFKHVGASWLTKENSAKETVNILHYLDAVWKQEALPQPTKHLILFGFSQGVSIALRWCVAKQIPCETLILYAGGIPEELTKEEVAFLIQSNTKVYFIYGDEDEYITPKRLEHQKTRIKGLFLGHANIRYFKGSHEMKPELIRELV
ncbi:Phospholipase/Carboxylesterase [Croceitalea dokdonensis DOKDO 023]|uniref:Phospholipase/Carboxylesterase n=1 Tax=Croceitalea dokdonensis DOKDO 023 TaxID=1300341 RepID=A0A0P7B3R3_9FLAO|nr:esterase [Croceitalea dokdonensis]KPM33210.1 Phospholipase/Carboxylesterase [Croceitalea dokdonensis DOKDO 023]